MLCEVFTGSNFNHNLNLGATNLEDECVEGGGGVHRCTKMTLHPNENDPLPCKGMLLKQNKKVLSCYLQ